MLCDKHKFTRLLDWDPDYKYRVTNVRVCMNCGTYETLRTSLISSHSCKTDIHRFIISEAEAGRMICQEGIKFLLCYNTLSGAWQACKDPEWMIDFICRLYKRGDVSTRFINAFLSKCNRGEKRDPNLRITAADVRTAIQSLNADFFALLEQKKIIDIYLSSEIEDMTVKEVMQKVSQSGNTHVLLVLTKMLHSIDN